MRLFDRSLSVVCAGLKRAEPAQSANRDGIAARFGYRRFRGGGARGNRAVGQRSDQRQADSKNRSAWVLFIRVPAASQLCADRHHEWIPNLCSHQHRSSSAAGGKSGRAVKDGRGFHEGRSDGRGPAPGYREPDAGPGGQPQRDAGPPYPQRRGPQCSRVCGSRSQRGGRGRPSGPGVDRFLQRRPVGHDRCSDGWHHDQHSRSSRRGPRWGPWGRRSWGP